MGKIYKTNSKFFTAHLTELQSDKRALNDLIVKANQLLDGYEDLKSTNKQDHNKDK